jgi:hypothetical protein
MADDYPYMISNNKIKPIIDAIHDAAKPPKFSHEFLKQIGFNSSNDRAVIPLFKRLGFLSENGAPTSYYDDLKDTTKREVALGARIRDLYSELYAINTKIPDAGEEAIKGAMSRVTGKDAASVGRYYATFKTICGIAKFEAPQVAAVEQEQEDTQNIGDQNNDVQNNNGGVAQVSVPNQAGFHYNIQIHLPATTDISVYNAIFKSLKDNLII